MAMLVLTISGVNAQGDAAVRFVHVIPDAVPVDIYVNGTLTVKGLEYGEASTYINVRSGNHTITATLAGITTPLWEQSVSFAADEAVTLIASNGAAPQFDRFNDNLNATGFGASRLLLIHALAGGTAVDVQLAEPVSLNGVVQDAGTGIASGLEYAGSFGAFDLPAQTYVVNVLPTGGSAFDVVLGSVPLSLNSGTSYMAVVYGSTDNPQALLLATPTAAADSGLLRFVQGVVGGPSVDVYANATLVAAGLTPDNPTAHIAVPAGEYEIAYVVANSDGALASSTVAVEAGNAQTIAAVASGDGVALSAFADDLSAVNEGTAVASVLNTIDGATVTVELSNRTVLSSDLAAGESSEATAFAPTSSSTSLTLTVGEDSGTIAGRTVTFYGGVYYNIIVLDGSAFSPPSLMIVPTSLSRGLASAPGAGEMSIAVGSVPTEAAPQQDTAPAQATSIPVVVTTGENVVVGEVALDPSANLQLRQYPRPDALSLGLAPSGTLLIINGREGAPVALVEGQDPPPEAATYVDPVTLLVDEDEDLEPSLTWLNVTYNTPDGGTIVAWVLSQYLILTDDEGLVDLRDLPTVPNNIAGAAVNTEITPPSPPEDIITATVINLSVGANLNMRRTPATDGEVLARLPLDTVVEFLGFIDTSAIITEADWAFIAYNPPEGGVITGWVSTLFLSYQWNGENADPAELLERELIGTADSETIGKISAGAPTVTIPTPDPLEDAYVAEVLLDPGANLQFRLAPDVTSESLNLIPNGTQLIIETRTSDGEWLQTSFEGQTGWISSQFVSITFNGEFIEDLTEIPVAVDSSN
jgi:uncharacterized protein YgiM (DUF1202 family)